MADKHLHILQHALGLDQNGQGESYRNHFCTSSGSVDHPLCMQLVERGLMTVRGGNEISGGADIFCVTANGQTYVAEHSPKPPKLTLAQRRYRHWLNVADCFPDWKFGDWLKSEYVKLVPHD